MRPLLLRPPVLLSGRTSDFSGVDRVTSTKSAPLEPRRPGVVGLLLRIAMWVSLRLSAPRRSAASGDRPSEDVDGSVGQGHDGALGVLALAHPEARATRLALTVDRVHRGDLDVEDLLDGDLDLGLVGVGGHDEGVLALVHQPVALLGDDRGQHDVAGILVQRAHLAASSSDEADSLTAFTNPAALAASSVANQTSALVRPYHGESGVWNFMESWLPLMSKPSGAEPSASGAAEPSPNGASCAAAGAAAGAAAALAAAKVEVGRVRVACATKSSSAPAVKITSSDSMTS